MKQLSEVIDRYIAYCTVQKNLDPKTIRADKSDLAHFLTSLRNLLLDQKMQMHILK